MISTGVQLLRILSMLTNIAGFRGSRMKNNRNILAKFIIL